MDPTHAREVYANMSDDQRRELAEMLDKQLDEYMDKFEATGERYLDRWNEETWEQEMEEHPFFTRNIDPSKELPPLLQGIQDLKYSPDENTPEELAKNYKEDGNFNFKCKKYRLAVASYTEGLRQRSDDTLLETQLLTNRAAAQFHLGNYRSSLLDCRLALSKTPEHVKAVTRAAHCCLQLKRWEEGKKMCDVGLQVNPSDSQLLDTRKLIVAGEKETERNRRRQIAAEKRRRSEEQKLLDVITAKGIKVERKGASSDLSLEDLEPTHPAAARKKVHFSEAETSKLVWPVLFLYPEHGETDFVEEFGEDDVFDDHLEAMFGSEIEPAPWDEEKKYLPDKIKLYFEDCNTSKLIEVEKSQSLQSVLSQGGYLVRGGTPALIALVDGSKFQSEFLQKYD